MLGDTTSFMAAKSLPTGTSWKMVVSQTKWTSPPTASPELPWG